MGSLRSSALVAALAFAAGGAAACTGTVVTSDADADTASVHALLVVEQSTPVTDDESTRSQASVWFLRATDDQAATDATRLVTDVLELPEDGACVMMGASSPPDVAATMTPVELAFAGDVQVLVGNAATDLAVRAFPDVAGLVSGVVYTVRRQTALDLASNNQVRVHASGASEMPSFDATTDAPPPIAGLAINGVAASSPDAAVLRGQPFYLSWTPSGGDDKVYVDLMAIPGSIEERVRCAVSDTGHLQVPAMAVPESESVKMTVHRVRDAALRSDGMETGAAHFDLAVSARVKVAGR